MKIGELKRKSASLDEVLEGYINTLRDSLSIQVHRATGSTNPNAPTHIVFAWGTHGALIKVGAGWEKPLIRGPKAGGTFISLTIDDPSLSGPMNVAAFPSDEPGVWDIVYRRRQEKAA